MLKKNKYGYHWHTERDLSKSPDMYGVKVNLKANLVDSWSWVSGIKLDKDKIKTIIITEDGTEIK